jgi:hypothetical protein
MGDLFRVTAPSGLKLRSAPSTTDSAVIIFAMLPGTIVEALGPQAAEDPHFVLVHVELDQANRFIMQDGEQPSTPAQTGYVSEEGYASADWLEPLGAAPGPSPDPGPIPSPPPIATTAASAATSTGGVMLLLVAVVAAALYAAK